MAYTSSRWPRSPSASPRPMTIDSRSNVSIVAGAGRRKQPATSSGESHVCPVVLRQYSIGSVGGSRLRRCPFLPFRCTGSGKRQQTAAQSAGRKPLVGGVEARFPAPRWPVSRYNVLPQQRLCLLAHLNLRSGCRPMTRDYSAGTIAVSAGLFGPGRNMRRRRARRTRQR